MKVERKTHANDIVVRYGKRYHNMERMLSDYFYLYDNKIPIMDKICHSPDMSSIEFVEKFSHNKYPFGTDHIIGYATSFDDTSFDIEFIPEKIPKEFNPDDYQISIGSILSKGHEEMLIFILTEFIMEHKPTPQ